MNVAIGNGSVCVLALSLAIGLATVQAASDDGFTGAISSGQTTQGAGASEPVDGRAASASIEGPDGLGGTTPVNCCVDREIYPQGKGGLCVSMSAPACALRGGQAVTSCRVCWNSRPMLAPAGAESEYGESFADRIDEAVHSEPSNATQTASIWTLLAATLFLAGL